MKCLQESVQIFLSPCLSVRQVKKRTCDIGNIFNPIKTLHQYKVPVHDSSQRCQRLKQSIYSLFLSLAHSHYI